MMLRFDLQELEGEMNDAVAEIIQELAVELSNQLQIESPVGATGRLQDSWFIAKREDDVIVLGSRVDYALDVWKGRGPHLADFDAIQVWARRKLGDESAAGPVWRHIAREGTEPNEYVERAIENTVDRAQRLQVSGL